MTADKNRCGLSVRYILLAGTSALIVFAAASMPAFAQDSTNRYDLKPITDLSKLSPPAQEAADAVDVVGGDVSSGVLARHVEGIDATQRFFNASELDCNGTASTGKKCELGDPFGKLLVGLAKAQEKLPRSLADLLAVVKSELHDFVDPDAFVVSEAGQISIAEAPTLERRARGVVVLKDAPGKKVVFVAPAMRADGDGLLEVIGWDAVKQLFNYYERTIDDQDEGVGFAWVWKGDSGHAWNSSTRNAACFVCHRNGEPVMKELRLPWQNWHSEDTSIKGESIPDDSPLKKDRLFSIVPESPFLKGGKTFEGTVKRWVGELNQSRIARYKSNALFVPMLLEPFFRTTTINLKPSPEQSRGVGGEIKVPWVFFSNGGIIPDFGDQGAECKAGEAFGQPLSPAGQRKLPSLSRADYDEVIAQLNFRLKQQGNYQRKPGDTHFAFLTPELAFTDKDLIIRLVERNIISLRFAVTMLMVDVSNPVYSPIREALFSIVPNWTSADIGSAGLTEQLVGVFETLHDTGDQPELVQAGLSQFMALWSGPAATWKADACAHLEGYMKNVGARWRAGDYLPYFKLLGARRESFLTSDHGELHESDLLFPNSDTNPNLLMHYDGTVKP